MSIRIFDIEKKIESQRDKMKKKEKGRKIETEQTIRKIATYRS